MAAGQGEQIIMLRFGAPAAIRQQGLLEPHPAEGGVQGDHAPGQRPALLQVLAHPQAGAVPPPDQPQPGGRCAWRNQRRHQPAGASFFHLHGLAEHLQATGLPQCFQQDSQIFGGGIVDLGLLHQHALQLGGGGRLELAIRLQGLGQHEAQQIGAIQLAAAQPNPHPQGPVAGQGPEVPGPAGGEGQTRGGGELGGGETGGAGQGNPPGPGNLQHGRGRQGQQAMGGGHTAVAGGGSGAHQLIHTQVQQSGADAHHIHQGIDRPHLVEVHRLRRLAMHHPLRLGQQGEHPQHPLPQGRRQCRLLQLGAQAAPVAMDWLRLKGPHLQMEAAQPLAAPLLQLQPVTAAEPQGRQRLFDHIGGYPQIEQGRQKHVAGQARGAIDQGQGHVRPLPVPGQGVEPARDDPAGGP